MLSNNDKMQHGRAVFMRSMQAFVKKKMVQTLGNI
jgi:hypothetical protein